MLMLRTVRHILGPAVRFVDFRNARRQMLGSSALTPAEKTLLSSVDLSTHRKDGMYQALQARHYLGVGLSAMSCIEAALTPGVPVRRVLDLPCGHGRVLRFLKARFPQAEIIACEIDQSAADYCASQFSATPLYSSSDISKIALRGQFDLIWCGSLITHFGWEAAREMLRFFHKHLTADGICVFTTHGKATEDWIRSGLETYGLSADSRKHLCDNVARDEYAYADYDGSTVYGISVFSRRKVKELAAESGDWHEVLFIDHGWDNHQDVYAFSKRERLAKIEFPPLPAKTAGKWRPRY